MIDDVNYSLRIECGIAIVWVRLVNCEAQGLRYAGGKKELPAIWKFEEAAAGRWICLAEMLLNVWHAF